MFQLQYVHGIPGGGRFTNYLERTNGVFVQFTFLTWLWNLRNRKHVRVEVWDKNQCNLTYNLFWNMQIIGHVCCWKALTASGMGWAWYPCDWHATRDRRHPAVNLTVNSHFRSVLNVKWYEWSKGEFCIKASILHYIYCCFGFTNIYNPCIWVIFFKRNYRQDYQIKNNQVMFCTII